MFDEATILARLQNGEDAQTIANEMAASLNKVNKMYTDQKAKEEAAAKAKAEAEAQAKRVNVQKKEELQAILDLFADWFGKYYEMDVTDLKEELNAEDVLELIESLNGYIQAIKGLDDMIHAKRPAKKVTVTKTADPDAVINSFLKNMGW